MGYNSIFQLSNIWFFVTLAVMPLAITKIRHYICTLLISILVLNPLFFSGQTGRSKTIAELIVDNDIVFLIDRYYSSGVAINLYSEGLRKSPINTILLPHSDVEKSYYSMSVSHRMYTPERTLTPDIVSNDHPYATYLLIGAQKISFNFNKKLKKTSKIDIGVIGPLAGGEVIQNNLHDNISIAQHSEGWHNQIKNDFCLQYSAMIEKGIVNIPMWEVNGFIGAKVGVPHTEAQVGGYSRFGIFHNYFRGIGIDISSDFNAWVFISGSIFLVNYNATLQGGTINQGNVHTIDPINNNLIQGRFGGVVEYKRLSVEYGMVVRSPEFNAAYWHRWAHFVIAFAF